MGILYTDTKIFHFPAKLADLARGVISPPIHIRLKPTNRCNHRCHYCCYRTQDLLMHERMDDVSAIPEARMMALVDEIIDMGVRAVTFSGGGEPLCYPHLGAAVKRLTDGGVKTAVLTNGALLEGTIAELLAERATWVRVSMDAGTGKTYSALRGVAIGEFDRVCRNLGEFARMPGRKSVLGVNFIVTKDNYHELAVFLSMAKVLGVGNVKISGVVVSTERSGNRRYHEPIFDATAAVIRDARKKLEDEGFTIIDRTHSPESMAGGYEKNYHGCPFSQCLTVIAADQQVYTCHDKAYTSAGLLGGIADRSLKDFWGSREITERLAWLDPSRDCRHHCAEHAKNLALLEYLSADTNHLEFV